MKIPKDYDFSGWATRNNIRCADGRTILPGAFSANDGESVSLVWNHQHTSPADVIGHALLENRPQGVYAYGYLNDTEYGVISKALLQHGDIVAMSICANQLSEDAARNVAKGTICEVSLVHKGANPGAYIESVMEHNEAEGEVANIYTGSGIFMNDGSSDELLHSNGGTNDDEISLEELKKVVDTMNDEQKDALYQLVGIASTKQSESDDEDDDDDNDNDNKEDEMKHNIFESNAGTQNNTETLTHADMQKIMSDAKRLGSLKDAVEENVENGFLMHALDTTGMETPTGTQTYGFRDPSMLFPDYKSLNNPPDWISREMGWVKKVMARVHHTPFSRIKSQFADITEDEARAKGYIKGNLKKEEVFTLLKRTTDPQTVYKKQKMDKDDITDIVDFDVVQWIKAEMRIMLDEELARAYLIGDGRSSASDDKIKEDHIRPIVTDVPLFNTKIKVKTKAGDTPDVLAKEIINAAIRARKYYKGSGNPDFFTTEDYLTEMLLIEDGIGHKLYKSEAELATALRVREIITVEPMEGYEVDSLPLIGTIVNLADYNVGADKGGSVELFDDFDIDYNQYKYLIETRCSGALIKPFSAITLLHEETT